MRSQAQTIYEVTVQYIGSLNTLRQREPFVVYFSNLTKAVENITNHLALNGWPPKVNYTAVYRSLKQRGSYHCDFDVAGARVFRIRITPRTLNPVLTTMGIDERPSEPTRKK
ncbi:hypothetical protein [Tellurirhabdus rosea]|uniref:hypothetical protein n=1 Tax=Tellurirhabdus rosea TaxID=2674997 RepID=UPI002252FB18|nr:hypothetical protein [Tellurirhabdus rosea]